ncbi:MAG: hypothetical protein KGZ58_02850 [Ignavibacteriales bacterium]|nr:hypothetical protein [Ignavibacteriales bacterium]
MLKLCCHIILLSFIVFGNTSSQPDSSKFVFTFLPEKHQFRQLIANPKEPTIGLWKFFTAEQMKVEIGSELDLFSFHNNSSSLNIGINFFGYANVTGANGLHLQIDALDGFFGGNISLINRDLQYRLRLLHHSAHLVDGNWWASKEWPRQWTKPGGPIPFTQDFGELVFAKVFHRPFLYTRLYSGISYATFSRPAFLKRASFLAGLELHSNKIIDNLFEKEINPFFAYHISLVGIPKYTGSHQIKAGIKFGEWERSGINLYFAVNEGRNFFGEYVSENLRTYGMGFAVDVP